MINRDESNINLSELRKPLRKFGNGKPYSRAKDRKDKKLYEIDIEDEDGVIEER